MIWARALALAGLLTMLTATAAGAQAVSPTSPPHPTMPWNFYGKPEWGQTIRYISVPSQPVVIDVPVSAATGTAAEPPQQQTVEIPGYIVVETTVGYLYPERWTLRQTGPGVYMWDRLPSEFRKK